MGYVDNLEPRIRSFLEDADLSTVSAKAVRKRLIADGEDADEIKTHKAAIDEKIGEIYEELAGGVSDDLPVKTRDSPPAEHPPTSQPQPLVERKPKREAIVEPDTVLAARMQAEFDSMQEGRSRRTAAPARKPKAKKRKNKSASDLDSDGEPKKKKRGGGGSGGGNFNTPQLLSDSLAAFVGEAQMSRPQVVKRLWDHIKGEDLQDPNDKRFILCDERMKSVFHVDRLHMFTMNKLLGPHLRKIEDVVGDQKPGPEIVDSDDDSE